MANWRRQVALLGVEVKCPPRNWNGTEIKLLDPQNNNPIRYPGCCMFWQDNIPYHDRTRSASSSSSYVVVPMAYSSQVRREAHIM